MKADSRAGDCLCATRFIPAIYDKYPNALINVHLDTNGNKMQETWLRTFYSYLYNDIITIPSKKYSKFVTDCQFAKGETTFGAIENIPDEYYERMTKGYDLFYDFHIDGMKWPNHPFNYFKYFYQFPEPQFERALVCPDTKYAFLNLIPDRVKDNKNISDAWYNRGLIRKLSEKMPCVIVATDTTYPLLKEFEGMASVQVFRGSITEVASLIEKSSLFIGLDSGLKYLAHAFGIPRIIFAEWCSEPHKISLAHKLRWLPTPEDCIPVNYDFNYVSNLAFKIMDNPILGVIPSIRNFESEAIVRNYTVDKEKSILL